MKLLDSSFKGQAYCHVEIGDNEVWPVTLRISDRIDDDVYNPRLIFHMTLPQLIAFKNSLIGAVESAMETECQSSTPK